MPRNTEASVRGVLNALPVIPSIIHGLHSLGLDFSLSDIAFATWQPVGLEES
ncbi:hypothetical protein NTGM5_390009 [Candidatus Nitrotoga sp. M5]|nr:hypothetical protein NTGM5_390009 [Candidatus Nitrotoga sp. M5]